jgi:Protein of unknown function (DUF3072)
MSSRKSSHEDRPRTRKRWDASDGPMTPDQIRHLKQLSQRAGDPDAFHEDLTFGEAQKRIVALETLLEREEHSGKERLPRT